MVPNQIVQLHFKKQTVAQSYFIWTVVSCIFKIFTRVISHTWANKYLHKRKCVHKFWSVAMEVSWVFSKIRRGWFCRVLFCSIPRSPCRIFAGIFLRPCNKLKVYFSATLKKTALLPVSSVDEEDDNENEISERNDAISNCRQCPRQGHIHFHQIIQMSGDSPESAKHQLALLGLPFVSFVLHVLSIDQQACN